MLLPKGWILTFDKEKCGVMELKSYESEQNFQPVHKGLRKRWEKVHALWSNPNRLV